MDKSFRFDHLGRLNVTALVIIFAIVSIFVLMTGAVLMPVFVRSDCAPSSSCQSNMSQIGRALKMYLSEWNDRYPTNRRYLPNGKLGPVSARVKLTPAGSTDNSNKPERFRHGVSWVEALYPYVEAVSKESSGVWACPAASKAKYPKNSNTAYVTYAFNRNLIERPEIAIHTASNLMVIRETDRYIDSELRPTNYSCGRSDVPPDSPFLTKHDSRIGETMQDIHNNGSNVLFADSHVKLFLADSFPDERHITAGKCWDAKDRRWYNSLDSKDQKNYKRIAITP